MVYKMMFHEIIVISLVPQVLANTYRTHYRQTDGEAQRGIIRFLVTASLDFDSVGVRIPVTNKEAYESLSHTWMENRAYESGYSYFEKFAVDVKENKETQQRVGKEKNPYYWKVPGPLSVGSMLTLTFRLMHSNSHQIGINLVDGRYPDTILLHTSIGPRIAYNNLNRGKWGAEVSYSDFSGRYDVIVLAMEIGYRHIHGTINGIYPSNIIQAPPGDTTTWLQFRYSEIVAHKIQYTRM